jgi:hypothetical protein
MRCVREWNWLCQTVWALGYDFELASETMLAEAEVDKKLHSLRLSHAAYRVVLLPSCISLQETTATLLDRFVRARGKLLAAAPVPYLLNGRVGLDPYPLERLLARWRTTILRGAVAEKTDKLRRILRKRVWTPVAVYRKPENVSSGEFIVQHRRSEALDLFYLFNRSGETIEALVEIRQEATLEEWDAVDGRPLALNHWHADGNTYTAVSFRPAKGKFIAARKKVCNNLDQISRAR